MRLPVHTSTQSTFIACKLTFVLLGTKQAHCAYINLRRWPTIPCYSRPSEQQLDIWRQSRTHSRSCTSQTLSSPPSHQRQSLTQLQWRHIGRTIRRSTPPVLLYPPVGSNNEDLVTVGSSQAFESWIWVTTLQPTFLSKNNSPFLLCQLLLYSCKG